MKILSRVTSPTTGKINIKGRVASLLEVGTGFHPELTGRENIYLNGAILGMRKKEIDRKFDEIVDFSGVERYIDTPVKRYSSGMYVRLAFAVAAHLESEILIVDEVLAVGDAEFQKKCLGKMGEVSKGEGRTILFVSHNLESIKQLCNVGIYLENGTINDSNKIEKVISRYNQAGSLNFELDENTNLAKRIDRCAANGKYGGNLRFSSLKFTNDKGQISTVFKKDEKILIEFEYKVFKQVNNFSVTIRFESALSSQVVTSNVIEISNKEIEVGVNGKVQITLFNLPINPGDYFIYLLAHNSEVSPFDIIDKLIVNVPIIEITAPTDILNQFNTINFNLEILK